MQSHVLTRAIQALERKQVHFGALAELQEVAGAPALATIYAPIIAVPAYGKAGHLQFGL